MAKQQTRPHVESPTPQTDNGSSNAASDETITPPSATPRHWINVASNGDEEEIKKAVSLELSKIISGRPIDRYHIIILSDEDSISDFHANQMYKAASLNVNNKDILLIINSRGGSIESAYLISKALKKLAKDRFVAVVPRRAKSAATLICLGADEIHMGTMSELGPIDPQMGKLPTLALSNALEALARLTSEFPGSSLMFSQYLTNSLELRYLGYFNRVSESAIQYAERLLANKELGEGETPSSVAERLVNHYKDHSFVIDLDEATDLLGSGMIYSDSEEYKTANQIIDFLGLFHFVLKRDQKKSLSWVGTIDRGGWIASVVNN